MATSQLDTKQRRLTSASCSRSHRIPLSSPEPHRLPTRPTNPTGQSDPPRQSSEVSTVIAPPSKPVQALTSRLRCCSPPYCITSHPSFSSRPSHSIDRRRCMLTFLTITPPPPINLTHLSHPLPFSSPGSLALPASLSSLISFHYCCSRWWYIRRSRTPSPDFQHPTSATL